jgi:hypothetical protein
MSVDRGRSAIQSKTSLGAWVLLAFLGGCGGAGGGAGTDSGSGSGGNGGGSGPPDLIAPTVTSMSPGEDTSGLGTNSKPTATLSEAMNPGVITAIDPATNKPANFRLSDGTITNGVIDYLPGTVSYDAANHVAVFTPATPLAPSTMYTATIITGVKDLAGNPLVNDFAWCFKTSAAADGAAPSVTSTSPVDTATGAAVNRKITATFSEDMNSSTLTAASFTVTGPGATAVSGTVTYRERTAVFAASSGLASNTTYTATVGAGAKDLAGNALQAKTWSFSTGANADATAPTVVSTHPADAGAGVAIGSPINVTLSEAMDPVTITTASFLVTGTTANGATPVKGIVAFDAITNTATFTRHNHFLTPAVCDLAPPSDLDPNTLYTATLTTGARDLAGNPLASNQVWTFTTSP